MRFWFVAAILLAYVRYWRRGPNYEDNPRYN